jgi:isopenicillin N synthase-like dioxygenase
MSALMATAVETTRLPVIDVSGLRSPDLARRRAVGAQLREACLDKGFFYISNHGVPESLIRQTFEASARFFDLPEPVKCALAKKLSPANRGYEPLRLQTLEPGTPPDLKEGFYIGNELAPDHPLVLARKFNHGPNQWPEGLPGFRAAMDSYFAALHEASMLLMRGVALSLELQENHFDALCVDSMETLRLLHYPPQPPHPLPDEKGCGAHTDFGVITLLAQDEAGGLQVHDGENGWIHAPPLPGTFVVNLGDMMARWTNGKYRSTLHRVVNLSGRSRYSMPFFFSGNIDHLVTCLPTCTGPGNPPRYPPVTIEQHFIECYARTYL